MRRLKEPVGAKTAIELMVFVESDMSYAGLQRWNNGARKRIRPKVFTPVGLGRVPVHLINNKQNLVQFLYDSIGAGKFVVMGWNQKMRNKNYSKSFVCLGSSCKFHPNNLSEKHCKRYAKFRKGYSCKMNKKFIANWCKRAKVEINSYDAFYFSYNRMYLYRWFWQGGK